MSKQVSASKFIFNMLIAFAMIFSPLLQATEVELTSARNLRDGSNPTPASQGSSSADVLKRVGRLEAGSIVDIPDQYIVMTNGKLDFDASVRKWMQDTNASLKPRFAKFNARQKDFFIPIKIVKAAPGSMFITADGKSTANPPANQNFLVSMRSVGVAHDQKAAPQNQKLTILKMDTPVYKAPKAAPPVHVAKAAQPPAKKAADVPTKSSTASQLEALCATCGLDPKPNGLNANFGVTTDIARQLMTPAQNGIPLQVSHAPKGLIAIAQKYNAMSDKFKKTCGIDLQAFTAGIDSQVQGTPFTTAEVLSIMAIESGGDCSPQVTNTNHHPYIHGLFGIQDPSFIKTHQNYVCSPAQIAKIEKLKKTPSQLQAAFLNVTNGDLNCLGNPFFNLVSAMSLLESKVTRPPASGTKFTTSQFARVAYDYNGNPEHQVSYAKEVSQFSDYLNSLRSTSSAQN